MTAGEMLKQARRLYLETSPFIYYVEGHPLFSAAIDFIFEVVESSNATLVSSTITLTEALSKPLREGKHELATAYRELLIETGQIHLMAVSSAIAQQAAHLRADYNLRTPDALHVATALLSNCDVLVTNDAGLKRVKHLPILVLHEFSLPASSDEAPS